MAEAVRLVIWDLDDTFWRGTLTEGGIKEYVRDHHDIVIELARRGIMSSICSKNDPADVLPILRDTGILDYFIFPSISWEAKGPRLAQLVEVVGLRPPTVMFVDDNANVRGEAVAMVPGLQVEGEQFIARMLSDPRFKGKDDTAFTRLAQYKLLEQRRRDETQVPGSNEEFLRGCDVRVLLDYDVESHLDRAIELINRTNQLNYTKCRLSEDPEQARIALRDLLHRHDRAAALVRVVDTYGDYGYVGFFLLHTGPREYGGNTVTTQLEHFCFSCRTLGMLIEQWVYDHLGRPALNVVGEVLTDLSVPRRIDWVRQVAVLGEPAGARAQFAPKVVLWGGCEVSSLAVYLQAEAGKVEAFGPYVANGVAVGANFAARVLDCWQNDPAAYRDEIARLGLPQELELPQLAAAECEEGTLYVFGLAADAHGRDRMRHRQQDWSVCLAPEGCGWNVILETSPDQLEVEMARTVNLTPEQKRNVHRVAGHVRANYELEASPDLTSVMLDTRLLLELIPKGAKVIILTRHEEEPSQEGGSDVSHLKQVAAYKQQVAALVAAYPYAATVSFTDALTGPQDILFGDHYAREVYLRVAQLLVGKAKALQPRQDTPASKRRLTRTLSALRTEERVRDEARDVIRATYDILLRRPAEPDMTERESAFIASGKAPAGWFIRAVAESEEFTHRWTPAGSIPAEPGTGMKFSDLRIPSDLSRSAVQPRRVLLVGSCLSETLREWMRHMPEPCESDFFFVGTDLPAHPPAPIGDYDFQIVQLALRLVLPDSAFARLGQLEETAHVRLFEHCLAVMRRHLGQALRYNRERGLLTIVLPFLEPVQNPVGRLLPRYDLRNPVYFIQRLNEEMERELAASSNAFLLDVNSILAHQGKRFSQEDVFMATNHGSFVIDFDYELDLNRLEPAGRATELFATRVPDSLAAIWCEIIALYRTVRQSDPVKLVIVDLDDTMWRGVMAETLTGDLPTSEGWPLGLWEALLFLKRRGILLAVVSKNEEARVMELWGQVFETRLLPSDFAVLKINWSPKAENIAQILTELNLLPRNTLYVDDNPVERAAVQAAYPEVRVLGGSPLLWRRTLLWSPETQVAAITTESANRTQMVRAQVDREEQRRSLSHEEFLASLRIKLTIFEVDRTDHPRFGRMLELVNKTNQFNTTGRRRTLEEFAAMFARGERVLAFEVADRFTQYGLVGVIMLDADGISQFVMSCRVLGLGVEQAAVAVVIDKMAQRGAASVFAAMIETDRNQPCRQLYAQCGFEPVPGGWRRAVDPRPERQAHLTLDLQALSAIRQVEAAE